MSKDKKYIIYCRQFANSHDDFIYMCDNLDSAKELFKQAVHDYHKYLSKLGLHINKIIYDGPRNKDEEGLPSVTFITVDRLVFEVEMVYG